MFLCYTLKHIIVGLEGSYKMVILVTGVVSENVKVCVCV